MKQGILLLNGEPYRRKIDDQNALVYCCDGAYNWAKGRVRIDENIGDFDSIECTPVPAPLEVYPSEKDFTDGEIALRRMIDRGVQSIYIYGGGGNREDHFIGNLQLLYYAHQKGVRAELVTNYSRIFLFSGIERWDLPVGTTVSLVPFTNEAYIEHSQGLYYPLEGLTLRQGNCRGISNVTTRQSVCIQCNKGVVMAFINDKE